MRAASLPFAGVNTVAIGSFRGLLDTKTPLKVAIVINLINLVLDPVLIYGIGQHAYSGAAGAALATTISEIAGSLIFLHMMRESGLLSTEPSTGERLFDFDGMKDLLAGGLSQVRGDGRERYHFAHCTVKRVFAAFIIAPAVTVGGGSLSLCALGKPETLVTSR